MGAERLPRVEETRVFRRSADVRAAELRDDSPSRGALDEAELQEKGLVHVLDRVRFLAERHRERRQAHRAAAELADDRAKQLAVGALESRAVDLEQLEGLSRDGGSDRT